jgi:hypothetical protein
MKPRKVAGQGHAERSIRALEGSVCGGEGVAHTADRTALMLSAGVRPEALKLLRRMTDPPPGDQSFVDEPIDLSQLRAVDLGDVWAAAQATRLWEARGPIRSLAADTARAVLKLAEDLEPAFRGSACSDYLNDLAREAEEKAPDESQAAHLWQKSLFVVCRCIDLSFEGLGPAAERFVAATGWVAMPHLAIALARLAGPALETQALKKFGADLAGSPLLVEEIRAVARFDLALNLLVAKAVYRAIGETASADRSHDPLSGHPGYVAFAQIGLEQALERVRSIHDSSLPYAADKAFTLQESAVIARLTRVALDRDEPWAPLVLDELFRKVSLAPTAAKTAPSQSVAIGLGHAVEAFPTPESVATLRRVLHDIRHAGVKKKLQPNLRGAERGLADRPEIALRLPLDQPLSKSQLITLSHCLEAGVALGMELTLDDWRIRLAEHAQARALAGSLVWRIRDGAGHGATVLPTMEAGQLTLRDGAGSIVVPGADCRVALWHPSDSNAEERGAWRDRLAVLGIKQPFKQVFREHYIVPPAELSQTETGMFAGHIVSIRPFLGLARRERWRLGYDDLFRSFGPWTARLDLADPVYPGCVGETAIRNITLWRLNGGKFLPTRLGALPPATISEILRAVDLLVSTSGFAITAEDEGSRRDNRLRRLAQSSLGSMMDMRKQALERALRDVDGMTDLQFDARHLLLGPYAIHLATGRVTRDGEPITVDPPKRFSLTAVPWLPHDERLLETILRTALEIAERRKGSPKLIA